jgi:FkbM family methyltransferase
MLNRIKKELIDFVIHILVLPEWRMRGRYKRLPDLLNKLLKPESGLRKVLVSIRKKVGSRLVGEIYCEANIYGTRIKMIDDRQFDYYYPFSRGEIHEPALTLQLKKLLEESDSSTFVDIGAHYGYFTIYAGKLIGSAGQVISIEPHIKFYSHLLKNIEINGLIGVIRTFNVALSEKEGKAQMEGWDERVLHEVENGNIQVVTFDQLCEKENIRPDIIKIDVHKAEGKVLSGMPNTLQNKVTHLFCELHNDMQGYTTCKIIQILQTAGLEVFEFTKHREESGGKIVPITDGLLSNHDDRMLYARRKGN